MQGAPLRCVMCKTLMLNKGTYVQHSTSKVCSLLMLCVTLPQNPLDSVAEKHLVPSFHALCQEQLFTVLLYPSV